MTSIPSSPETGSSGTPPISGQRVTITITDIAFGGEGVGRMEQFVVFVPFVALGEVVEAELVEVKKQFGRAKLIRVIQPSPDRATPQSVRPR